MEYQFDRYGREWKFDYAWPKEKVAVEQDGGIGKKLPSHSSIGNIRRDMQKGNEAQRQGWRFIRIEPPQLRQMATIDLIAELLGI